MEKPSKRIEEFVAKVKDDAVDFFGEDAHEVIAATAQNYELVAIKMVLDELWNEINKTNK